MDEIAASVAAKIAGCLFAPVGRPFIYLWNYKTNLENLKNEVEKLKAMKRSVERLISVGEETMPHVEIWQKSVDQIIPEAELSSEDNLEQESIQCCIGFSFLNLINRYQRSKNAAKKLKDVLKLKQEAAPFLRKVAISTSIPDEPWLRSGDGYEAYESRRSVLKNIIDALLNPGINVVGIYGMGGIGKTTLAQKVAIHAKHDNLFHVIVFVEVSKTPNIKNIQQEIGGKLGLKFHDKTEGERARALYDQLKKEVTVSKGADKSGEEKKEKKILLILDNIWEKIDLEEVGIPLEGDCKGLKLLLTTRNSDVLTNQMDFKCNFSVCNFSVDTLEDAEAWSLFKSTAGTCVDHPDLRFIAPEVAKECGGMPLAIVAIANALKGKVVSTWSTALEELKIPSLENFEGIRTKKVYTSIKLSYEYLDSELREIFLLCSRMGHTYDASVQDLFRYGFGLGLGFLKKFNTLEKAQCKVEDLVKQIKDNSLLLDVTIETRESQGYGIPNSERFAMHDVICDVARSIDCGKGNVCNVIDDVILCNWDMLKNCTSITLHDISKVPKDLRSVFPQLEFFYMKTKKVFSRIPDDFFAEMPRLRVLHLIEMNLSPLPTSFSHLVNLQTLCLDACKLGDIADIGKLEKLEILSFCGSKIWELPKEMRQLTNIRLLDLTNCSTLEIIPPNVISCFTRLEALYMYGTLIRWEDGGLNVVGSLDELKHLRDHLTTLEICIPNVKMSEGLLSPQLKRYKISIGCNQISPSENSKTLSVNLNTNENADEVISQLKGIKQLELGCADRRYGFTADSKQSVSLDALFSLESLSLRGLNFEKICNVPLAAGSFCQLRTITVYGCHKLTNIFSFSIDRVLPKLQEIRLSDCKNMEGIFAIEREDDVNNSELIHEIQFSQLCSVTLRDLPKLKSFCHRVKTTSQLQLTSSTNDGEIISEDMIDIPKSLFNEKVVFPNMETLEIDGISAEKIWHNQLPTMSSFFQNLNRLDVRRCHNLKELFSSSMVNSFVQLQYLEISECSLLEEVVFMEESREEERKDTQFPFLKEMIISNCPNLKAFISNGKIGFPSLKAMHIDSCPIFEEFIFNDKVEVPNIEELTIWYMDNLKKIWHNQLVNDSFCKLKSLEVHGCEKLLNVFPSNICGSLLSSLESLAVDSCDSLEEIFDLRKLNLYDSQIILSFAKLQKLGVSDCGSLKNLFSASILAKEGVVTEEAHARFLFPKLTSFKLDDLPELRSFYPGRHKVEGPVLKKLKLSDCGIHDTDEEGQMQQPSFFSLVEEAFHCLEELSLDGKQVTMLCQGQFPESFFDRLKILRFINDESISPFDIIQRCHNLEELSLFRSHYKEIFPHVEDQTHTKIKTLNLSSLYNLKYIWKQNSKLDLIIQHLEVLKVEWCDSLINLMPPPTSFQNPSTSFQNLTSLKVEDCNSLINMGTSTVAKSLVQLTEMSISSCKKLREVIGNQGDVVEDEIIFRKLKSLNLHKLPSLTSFCSWKFTLKFPSLETFTVQRCPNLKIFSQGDLTTEKLQEVEIDEESVELRSHFNLNTAIQQSYEKANSAKDNGASSSHHFEIDQESIQQSDEEAIQQSHEEANEDYSASSSDHSE